MAALEKVCPACGSQDVTFLDKRKVYLCQDCEHRFKLEKESKSLRIFLSYGHDEHAVLAQRLNDDFQKHHHEVWFDIERLKPGGDWETYIEEGLEWTASESETGRVVLLHLSVFRSNGGMYDKRQSCRGFGNVQYRI